MWKQRKTGRPVRAKRESLAMENRQRAVPIEVATLDGVFRKICREIGLKYPAAAVCFVTDRDMKRLNRTYRGKNKTTDVLSFPSEERPKPKSLKRAARALRGEFLGDIAISATVARENAEGFGRSVAEEIGVLLLHGVLHLMGYDHESDRGEMEIIETKLRQQLGLTP